MDRVSLRTLTVLGAALAGGSLTCWLSQYMYISVLCVVASVMGYLVDRVSPRTLTVLGAALAGASLTCCAFAPSLTFITVAFGVVGGQYLLGAASHPMKGATEQSLIHQKKKTDCSEIIGGSRLIRICLIRIP